MSYQSTHPLFKSLTDEEEQEFREHARTNDPERLDRWEIYHPVCREEWIKRGVRPGFASEGI